MNYLSFSAALAISADTAAKPVVGWNIYSFIVEKLGIGNTVEALVLQFAAVLICIIVPYLIGSINPAIIFSKKVFHDDIRTHGSGNAGTTNTLRTYGKKMAVLIFSLDLVKAALATLFGSLIMTREVGGAIAGFFVIFGHMFPIYYKFKGGKGVACLATVVLILSPISFFILIPLFAAIVLMTGYVSLGSIMGVMLYPVIQFAFYPQHGTITLSSIFTMIFVVFMHRENIKRLLAGTESKLSITSKKKKKPEKEGKALENGENDDGQA